MNDDQLWDYCEITFSYQDDRRIQFPPQGWLRFIARATGPNGRYAAAESPRVPLVRTIGTSPYPSRSNPVHQNLHQDLVQTLRRHGWQPLPLDDERWWINRFRRKSRPRYSFWQRLWRQIKSQFKQGG